MNVSRRRIILASAAALPVVCFARYARAQGAGYYKDKLITLIVPGSSSGGHARYTRMIAPYLQKHTGAREVRVTFMQGGGGLIGANNLWRAKPDGYTIALAAIPTLILAPIAGSPGAQFDPTKFTFCGRATAELRVLTVGGKSAIKTVEDLSKLNRPFVYPSQGTDEDFYTMAVLADALNFKLKAVTGYEGNADTALAVIKGDGDGHIMSYSQAESAIKAGDKRPILTIGSTRHPDYPNVPTALEVVKGEKAAGIRAIVSTIELHRSFIGPPNMNADATAALRAAVKATMSDPDLLKEAEKNRMPLAPMDGAEQQKLVAEIAKASAGIAPILRAAVKEIQ
jgi:tripartite-type tricarboxylate transporter receptor subunit TctC